MATSADLSTPLFIDALELTAAEARRAMSFFIASPDEVTPLNVAGGVKPSYMGDHLRVSWSSGMNLSVRTGTCVVPNSTVTDGPYICALTTLSTLVVPTSDPTYGRLDIVAVVIEDIGTSGSTAVVKIITGTPSATPVAPTLPDDSLLLATITVGAGVSTLASDKVADERTTANLLGSVMPVATASDFPNYAADGTIGYAKDTGILYISASGVWTEVQTGGGGDSLEYTAVPDDQVYSGLTISLTYGESLVPGDAVYLKSDGSVWKADADAITTAPCMGLALETASSGSHLVLLHGIYRDDTRYAWTVGGVLYLSTTGGSLTQTAPSGTDDVIQVCGIATHADRVYFRPDLTWITHT